MLDHFRIEELIAEIRRRLNVLHDTAAEVDQVKFLADSLIADASERRLQVAMQACIDVANHIVAQMALEKPKKENKEVFLILAKHKIIDKDLAEKLVCMAGMRNVLVHQYTEVARDKVYQAIKHDLSDIEEYVAQIQKFLDKERK